MNGSRNESGKKTISKASGETVTKYRFVKGNFTDGVQYPELGEGDEVVGITQEDDSVISAGQITVFLLGYGGTFLLEVGEACSAGDFLYPNADGKGLSSTGIGRPAAVAQEAASGDGSIIEVRGLSASEVANAPDGFGGLLNAAATTAALATALGLTVGDTAKDRHGNIYRLVLNDNVNGAAIGTPLGIRDAGSSWNDCTDDTAAASSALFVAGAAASTFSSTNVVGWMLVQGNLETALDGAGMTLKTDGNVEQGEWLFWSADGDFGSEHGGDTPADRGFCGRAGEDDSSDDLTKGYIDALSGAFNSAA
jgi:hypothetical protein